MQAPARAGGTERVPGAVDAVGAEDVQGRPVDDEQRVEAAPVQRADLVGDVGCEPDGELVRERQRLPPRRSCACALERAGCMISLNSEWHMCAWIWVSA